MNKFAISYATLVFVGAIKINRGEIPDGQTVHTDNLKASIKATHTAAEAAR